MTELATELATGRLPVIAYGFIDTGLAELDKIAD